MIREDSKLQTSVLFEMYVSVILDELGHPPSPALTVLSSPHVTNGKESWRIKNRA